MSRLECFSDYFHGRREPRARAPEPLKEAPPWDEPPLTPVELKERLMLERTPTERLAALETADPTQKRPLKRPSILEKVDFFDTDDYTDDTD